MPAAAVEWLPNLPSEKAQALRTGDELELEIALWGLGTDAKSRRPVRDFCLVGWRWVNTLRSR